ncbi:MAG: hypothetical protein CMQ20_15740 [Gammaproteobacteria bacterium]|nr:hypothetical protein [Gammaproteobacteria bacterium]
MYPRSVSIRSRAALLLSVQLLLLAGCSNPEAEEAKQQAELDKRGLELSAYLLDRDVQTELQEGLAVHLAFGAEADLDLYVTDPLLETVYFANRKSKSGGEISDDIRCGTDEIGVEEIRFIAPMPGRYRIGIDYPSRCADEIKKAAYALSIQHDGKRQEAHGSVSLQRFDVIALEFEIE